MLPVCGPPRRRLPSPTLRRLAVLGMLAVAASVLVAVTAPGASGAPSATTAATKHKLSTTWGINNTPYSFLCAQCGPGGTPQVVHGCSYFLYLQFPAYSKATAYDIVVRDKHPRVNTTYHLHGPPFQDHVEGFDAAKGTHRYQGFTGGSGGGPCTSLSSVMGQVPGGRFKILSATYTTGGKSTIAGTAYNAKGTAIGGVAVKVGKESAVTDGSGYYSVDVEDGTYAVSVAKGMCVMPQGRSCRSSTSVKVKDSSEQVDFQEPSYAISGTVRRACASTTASCSAKGIANVGITAHSDAGGDRYATTDGKGRYTIDGAGKGRWVLTPLKQGTTIDPPTRSVTIGSSDKTGIDFDGCDATAKLPKLAWAAQAAEQHLSGSGPSLEGRVQTFDAYQTTLKDCRIKVQINWNALYDQGILGLACQRRNVQLVHTLDQGKYEAILPITGRESGSTGNLTGSLHFQVGTLDGRPAIQIASAKVKDLSSSCEVTLARAVGLV